MEDISAAKRFEKNRKKLFALLEEGDAAVLFCGDPVLREGDDFYPFTPGSNFYYLTGIEAPGAVLVMEKTGEKCRLYIAPPNGETAKWVGENMSAEEAKFISGIKDIKYNENIWEKLADKLKTAKRVYSEAGPRGGDEFAKIISFENIIPLMAELREIKEDWEIEKTQRAIDITERGIAAMMQTSRPGLYEYEIESAFDEKLKRSGVFEKAFESIVAAGKNGTVLHYTQNNSQTKDGDLLLCDLGASFEHYRADITRTFPVNGRFTDRQRKVYEVVLCANKKVIAAVKPGIEAAGLNEIVIDIYFDALKEWGLIKERSEVSRYYYHRVSHFLGLLTHDITGTRSEPEWKDTVLKPGMLLTVEPGLYIPEWEIGIRIEVDVLVTEEGCRVLSENIIKEADEIEEFMNAGK
ncbi:MAG: aminopeptidase P N-terminal domain-containing protein [Firmicutes bacterium]|nr:aminopeptidase P N-terminal domain-containing protein [Bacillota bacterium]